MKNLILSLVFLISINTLAKNCPADATRVRGSANLSQNLEAFYKILQSDISMGSLIHGIDQTFQTLGYSFAVSSEFSSIVLNPQPKDVGLYFDSSFVLTTTATKLDIHSPLGHRIHMPELVISGEISVSSADQIEACISSVEIQNTTFGSL